MQTDTQEIKRSWEPIQFTEYAETVSVLTHEIYENVTILSYM